MTDFQVAQIDHVELFVPNRREAAAWYHRVLGLAVVSELEHFEADPKGPLMIGTKSGSTKLALFTGAPIGSRRNSGFYRVAFSATADAFLQLLDRLPDLQLHSQTGRVIGRQDVVDHGQAWSIYFCDPWKHQLEVTTYEYDEFKAGLGQ